jgi:hypothetical protein
MSTAPCGVREIAGAEPSVRVPAAHAGAAITEDSNAKNPEIAANGLIKNLFIVLFFKFSAPDVT